MLMLFGMRPDVFSSDHLIEVIRKGRRVLQWEAPPATLIRIN